MSKRTQGKKRKRTDSVTMDYKIFNDPIHGSIKVNGLCVKIINTPQFQRLRYLSQLGLAYFVYPGATHTRFEHCIGAYHLAGEFARTLKSNQPELGITDREILCIEVAGLCHDLGHGPFSHLFDGPFMSEIRRRTPKSEDAPREWKHEKASTDMIDLILVKNPDIKRELDDKDDKGWDFVKELIDPPKENKKRLRNGKPYLYEVLLNIVIQDIKLRKILLGVQIVSNTRNGIDVDKWDYFVRDAYMLGMKTGFDFKRYMMFARVIDVEGEGKQICMRDKEAMNVYELFNTRAMLHRKAYKHKVVVGINLMLVDALVKANDYIKIPGADGELKKMSESIDDMEAYEKLNDGIIQHIILSKDKRLKESRAIIKRIHSRDLYKCVGESIQSSESELNENDIRKKISDASDGDISEKDIVVKLREIAYWKKDKDPVECVRFYRKGDLNEAFEMTKDELREIAYWKKDKDPVECVRFYRKGDLNEAFEMTKDEVSTLLPQNFQEILVTLYVKKSKKQKAASDAFEKFCDDSEDVEHPIRFL